MRIKNNSYAYHVALILLCYSNIPLPRVNCIKSFNLLLIPLFILGFPVQIQLSELDHLVFQVGAIVLDRLRLCAIYIRVAILFFVTVIQQRRLNSKIFQFGFCLQMREVILEELALPLHHFQLANLLLQLVQISVQEVNNRESIILMSQEASNKSEKFRMEIRKRQRQDIMRKQRQLLIANEVLANNESLKSHKLDVAVEQLPNLITEGMIHSSIKGLYQAFSAHSNYMDAVPLHMINGLIHLIISKESIETNEGVQLLSMFLIYSSHNQSNANKKAQILKVLELAHIEEELFNQIQKSMGCEDKARVKLLANCLKLLALNKYEPIRRKDLLDLYLGPLIEKHIKELSVMIFLVFVSEIHPFTYQIVRYVCEQSKAQDFLAKSSVSAFLNNYIICETNEQNIATLFEPIMSTLQFLMVKCKGHNNKYLKFNLEIMIALIEKYPEMREAELLTKISKCQLQQLVIILLNVSDEETKELVFQLEESIIDKTIHELKQQFFLRFSMEVIYQVVQGIEYTRPSVISRCLKIIAKLAKYAPPYVITKIKSENLIAHTLQDLCYHKNEFISALASDLKPIFEQGEESQPMEQC